MPTQNTPFPLETAWKGFYGTGMAQRGSGPFPGWAAPCQDPRRGNLRGTAHNSSFQEHLAAAAPGGKDATLHASVPTASLHPLKATCLNSGAGTVPLHGHSTITPLPPNQPSLECVLAPSSALIQQPQNFFFPFIFNLTASP